MHDVTKCCVIFVNNYKKEEMMMAKKLVLALYLIVAGAAWCSAQPTAEAAGSSQQPGTAATRDTVSLVAVDKIKDKATRNEVKAQLGTMRFQKAARAMRDGYFVLMASSVRHSPSGAIDASADEQSNFVLVQGQAGVFQTAGHGINPGLNNMGGFTFKGRVGKPRFSSNKKGDLSMSFTLVGSDVNCDVFITLFHGTGDAEATVTPAMGRGSFTLRGRLRPYNAQKHQSRK